MSGMLHLTSEFLERMTDPAYGAQINEEYGLRFGALIQDEDSLEVFREHLEGLSDPRLFSAPTWLWLLQWARSRDYVLREDLLERLIDQFPHPFMQTYVIAAGTTRVEGWQDARVSPLERFEHPWLRRVMLRLVAPVGSESADERVQAHPATTFVIALMQVGTPVCRAAAIALARYEWIGRQSLLDNLQQRLANMDDATREEWIRRFRRDEEEGLTL